MKTAGIVVLLCASFENDVANGAEEPRGDEGDIILLRPLLTGWLLQKQTGRN